VWKPIEHRVVVGGRELSVLAAPGREPELADDTDPDRIPYWTVLWDSSQALAPWLAENPNRWTGPILELGCGVGLAGLAAASLGAEVIQTDLFPEAVRVAGENATRNGLKLRHLAADWRHWPLQGRFPTIIAADVLYERPAHSPLLEVLQAALGPGGVVYLTDPGRPMLSGFKELAHRAGWQIAETDLSPHGQSEVRLLELRLPVRTPPEHPARRGK
jgi:predicted nicotinamide N-methyase